MNNKKLENLILIIEICYHSFGIFLVLSFIFLIILIALIQKKFLYFLGIKIL